MFDEIVKIFIGAIVVGILLMVLIVTLGAISEHASKTIPENSKWAETQRDLDNTSQSAIEIISMDPTDMLIILGIFGSIGVGGYAFYQYKR